MHKLSELNPAVGTVVLYEGRGYKVKYKSKHQSYLLEPCDSPSGWKEWFVVKDNFYAAQPKWTLKPKEQPMKTLAELNPQVGDTVRYRSYYPQNCGDFVVEETPAVTYRWSLRPVGGGVTWWPNAETLLPVWTLKPQPEAPVTETKHTLVELNPQVGDTVLFHSYHKSEPQEYVFEERADYYWYLRPSGGGELWWCTGDANCPKWTLKQENKVTVAELKLSVGDRVTDKNLQGVTYTGSVIEAFADSQQVRVLWDWTGILSTYYLNNQTTLTKLPKPEPTLADLNLKVGDPVLNTRNGRCALVYALCDPYINLRYCCGDTLTLFQTDPVTRLKKLEVPQ